MAVVEWADFSPPLLRTALAEIIGWLAVIYDPHASNEQRQLAQKVQVVRPCFSRMIQTSRDNGRLSHIILAALRPAER